jgi:hypothetical protein
MFVISMKTGAGKAVENATHVVEPHEILEPNEDAVNFSVLRHKAHILQSWALR